MSLATRAWLRLRRRSEGDDGVGNASGVVGAGIVSASGIVSALGNVTGVSVMVVGMCERD